MLENINSFLWERLGLILLLGTGVLMTVRTKCFVVRRFSHWMKSTAGSLFKKDTAKSSQHGAVSQLGAVCTALAATLGVGNIAGVSAAIALGGPGAIFWMWVAAFFGMTTTYCENVLGVFYRRKNKKNEWVGGAMYYLHDGLGRRRGCGTVGRVAAALFALFCVPASFGIGNASQINTIVTNIRTVLPLPALSRVKFCGTDLYMLLLGLLLATAAGAALLGGIGRIARVTEKIVPFMVVGYILGCGAIIFLNAERLLPAMGSIFRHALGLRSAAGGVTGAAVRRVMSWGFKRGVFSNEAGLGSAAIVGAAADVREPVRQGMWGIFEVFLDTIVVCTVTALCVLCSGLVDLSSGSVLADTAETALVSAAFSHSFGSAGGIFIALSVLLFAFATVLGWSYYGQAAWEYLFGGSSVIIYKALYLAVIVAGATIDLSVIWALSDIANALMMLPNLVGVLSLQSVVVRLTENYTARVLEHKPLRAMLTFDPVKIK